MTLNMNINFMYSLNLTSSKLIHSRYVDSLHLRSILRNINMFAFRFVIDVLSGLFLASSAVTIIISKFTYYLQTPLPCLVLSFHSPSQVLPSAYFQTPLPFIISSLNSPSQVLPLAHLKTPLPFIISSLHSPSQVLPSAYFQTPLPCLLLSL